MLKLKKRLSQPMDCLIPAEKRVKVIPPSSDGWSTNNHYQYSQTAFSSVKKDNHSGEYSFGSCLSRPTLIPPHLPTEVAVTISNNCPRPSPLRIVRPNSPASNEPKNPSITNFNDFSPDGIRQIVESTVSSPRARHQLLTYISQLQLAAYAHSTKTNQQNENILLRRENELLRERLSKLEAQQISSNSSTISKISSNDHNQQQDSTVGDLDDLESNVSSHSISSSIAHDTTMNDQPKYFDRKRRLLAAEQQIPTSETEILITKKSSPYKKACLDEIVDSLNQKAQAEQEENGEKDEHVIKQGENNDEEEIIITANNDLTPPSTTTEREDEDEDIDIDDGKLADDEH